MVRITTLALVMGLLAGCEQAPEKPADGPATSPQQAEGVKNSQDAVGETETLKESTTDVTSATGVAVKESVRAAGDSAKEVIAGQAFTTNGTALTAKEAGKSVGDAVKDVAASVSDAAKGEAVKGAATTAGDAAKDVANTAGGIFKGLFKSSKDSVEPAKGEPTEKAKEPEPKFPEPAQETVPPNP